ncbi:MAG: hypothetical protein AAF654_01365 [Myxococcota bacterium]
MRPHFRTDLKCSREEQQGVVFYRIDDPRTETNFRLYEIEFLIAQELNGERSVAEVIDVVKDQHNFDISEPDLQRFVSQLESMGFLENGATGNGAGFADASTRELDLQASPPPVAPTDDLLPELDLADAEEVDRGELDRLMRSALMHVKQGYLMHARDYFLAARELQPNNEQLELVISHLEIVGETPAAAEMEYIWEQASKLAPEIAVDLGEFGSEPPPDMPAPETLRVESEEDLKSRLLWTMALVVVLILGTVAIYWATQESDIFSAPKPVRVSALKSTRVPRYFTETATQVRPLKERVFGFTESGTVGAVTVGVGESVQRDQVIAMLELPRRQSKKLNGARAKVRKAEAAYEKAAKRLSVLDAEAQAVQVDRDRADEQLKELQPKQLLGRGGVSKRDIEKWKKAKVQANRKLTQLAKKRRKPEGQERKAKRKLDQARKKLGDVERRLGGKVLRAPISGRVAVLKIEEGASVQSKAPLVTVRDERGVILSFVLNDAPTLQAGGQAFVAVGRAKPTNAKVFGRKDEGETANLEVELEDPTGAYLQTQPKEFRLVRDYVEPAFDVPASALSKAGGEPHVFIVLQNRAQAVPVLVLEENAAQVVVTNASGSLRNGDKVVTAEVETGSVEQLRDGSLLEPE